jgi:hypothetical protein
LQTKVEGDDLEGLTGAALEARLEADYWRLVDGDSRREVNVEYGNDLDVTRLRLKKAGENGERWYQKLASRAFSARRRID